MNQILTFQLDSISINEGIPENNGIQINVQIQETFDVNWFLQF